VFAACRALNGEVSVESEPGLGTRFRFVFPRPLVDLSARWSEAGDLRPSAAPERTRDSEPEARAALPAETA